MVYKPNGPTSYDVIRQLKKLVGKDEKIGHCGTLDPAAEGILLVVFGPTTKKQAELMNLPKTYRVQIRLGLQTTTGDVQGKIVKEMPVPQITEEFIQKVLSEFSGEITQVPPMYSAVRYRGRRLYELARKNVLVERVARRVQIYSIELLKIDLPRLVLRVVCSRGTYIRTLAEDIAQKLNTVGMVEELIREKVGDYDRKKALNYSEIGKITVKELKEKFLFKYA